MIHNHARSHQFLMEFLVAILFFSLSSAACIQLFVQSYMLSNKSVNQNHACMWAENVAEIFNGSNGDFTSIEVILSQTEHINTELLHHLPASAPTTSDQQLCLYFDSQWNLISSSDLIDQASFTLLLSCKNDTTFQTGTISVFTLLSNSDYDSSSSLYSLTLRQYINATLKDLE